MEPFILIAFAAGVALFLGTSKRDEKSIIKIVGSVGVGDMDQQLNKFVEKALQPRGIRNNNPLNIRWNSANNWDGQTGKDKDGFAIFDKPENGIRAAAKILDSYAKRGIKTVGEIVGTWAPAVENNVAAYVNHVVLYTGWDANKVVDKSAGDYVPLLIVMTRHENGEEPYGHSVFERGVALS